MFSSLRTIFFIFLFFEYSYEQCDTECCQVNDFEFQCPTESGNIVIHTKDEEILIQCPSDLENLITQQFPKIIANKTDRFIVNGCPWPNQSIKEFFRKFSLSKIQYFEFSESHLETLSGDFEGLENLKILNLNTNGIKNINEKIFLNTPNLEWLELDANGIITLSQDSFKNLPLLEFLDLSNNNLEDLPPNVFRPLKNLKNIHLWGNKLTKLDDSVFRYVAELESLELSTNQIDYISESAFKELKNLRRINLSSNKIIEVSPNLFIHNKNLEEVMMSYNFQLRLPDYFLANMFLTKVDLGHCRLEVIPENIISNSTSLKIIKLEHNRVKYLPEVLFKGLVNLEEIWLQNNNIESISKVFTDLKHLKTLYLQNNLISMLAFEVFADLENLEEINLKNNRLYNIDAQLFSNKRKLQIINISHNRIITPFDKIIDLEGALNLTNLDLSHNNISLLKLGNFKPKAGLLVQMDYNPVTTVDFQNLDLYSKLNKSLISLKNSPIQCDCHNYDLFKFLQNKKKEDYFIDIRIENYKCANIWKHMMVPLSSLTCPLEDLSNYTRCPEKCSCKWRPFDKSIAIDCSYTNLTKFPDIDFSQITVKFNQIAANFQGNDLTTGPDYLTGYDNITQLILSNNKIREITWLPPRLQILALDHNHLTNLDEKIVKQLNNSHLVKLALDDNPWLCACNSLTLTKFLLQRSNLIDRTDLHCVNSNKLLIHLKEGDLCHTWNFIYTILVALSVLLILAVLVAFYYRYQRAIKVWLFAKNLCLCWVSEEELDKDKTYDAFVSYSHKDEDFVASKLLPGLGSFKLCLHQRDWTPGEFITTQIDTSVRESRRTLVVLSANFLDSHWGRLEFHTAYSEAMKEGRSRVIIVLYGDVNIDGLDEELKTYLKMNTYVKWGEPHFWSKLQYALPHKRGGKMSKLRNFSNCSDEYNLITSSAPSSPGLTPTYSSTSSLAKANPFCFDGGHIKKPLSTV